MDAFSGTAVKIDFAPIWKGVYSKRKEFAPFCVLRGLDPLDRFSAIFLQGRQLL